MAKNIPDANPIKALKSMRPAPGFKMNNTPINPRIRDHKR